MKNSIMHNAIPEHSDANLATANGNANITIAVTVIQIITALRLSITHSLQFHAFHFNAFRSQRVISLNCNLSVSQTICTINPLFASHSKKTGLRHTFLSKLLVHLYHGRHNKSQRAQGHHKNKEIQITYMFLQPARHHSRQHHTKRHETRAEGVMGSLDRKSVV